MRQLAEEEVHQRLHPRDVEPLAFRVQGPRGAACRVDADCTAPNREPAHGEPTQRHSADRAAADGKAPERQAAKRQQAQRRSPKADPARRRGWVNGVGRILRLSDDDSLVVRPLRPRAGRRGEEAYADLHAGAHPDA